MRRSLASLLVVLTLLAVPTSAHAHVRLKRSDPGAGAILTTTPLDLKFWFSEPVELAVTRIAVIDARGRSIGLAEPAFNARDNGRVDIQLLSPLGAGTYKVTYQTVALDGHPLSGSYTFRILGENEAIDTAFAAEAARAQRDSAVATARAKEVEKRKDVLDIRSTDPSYVITRTLSLTALLLVISAPLFWFFVLQRTAEIDHAAWKRIGDRVATLAALAALAFLTFAFVRLFLQTRLVSGNDVPDVGDIGNLVLRTNWGLYWRVQITSAIVAVFALLLRGVMKSVAWYVAAGAALCLAFATSFSSHAGASEVMRGFGVFNDALHVLGVSTWLGGLFWLLFAALPQVAAVEKKSKRVLALVDGFSRTALVSASIVVLTGIVSARFRAGTFAALLGTTYGQVLVLKIVLVMVVAAIGFHNWKTVRPSLAGEGSVDQLQTTGRRELSAAVFVIIVTAILVALPTPGAS